MKTVEPHYEGKAASASLYRARMTTSETDAAWAAAKRRFLVPETGLLADFLGADGLAGLPTSDEVRRAFPDRHGYGTGQEDCMIHAGAMLDALASRAEAAERGAAAPAPRAAADAATLVGGVARCCFAHGRPGFLARSVCRTEPSLCYPATSRDQITMAVFGLWRLLRSPLAAAAPAAALPPPPHLILQLSHKNPGAFWMAPRGGRV
jgi:hypothetical protein